MGRRPLRQKNVVISVFIAMLIFLGFQLSLFYRDCLTLEEKKFELEAEIRQMNLIIASQKRRLITKDRDIFRLERSLRKYESRTFRQSHGFNSIYNVTIYLITATYARPTQKADLTRLSHTLSLVPNVFWIIVEDSPLGNSPIVQGVAERSKIRHVLLSAVTPEDKKVMSGQAEWTWPRGVAQRNEGLRWLRKNLHAEASGVVYIADDDNTYDVRIFEEMRAIKKVGIWPVAFVGQLMVERPFVENGRVTGWNVQWGKKRPYAVDMAGFAVNLKLLMARPEAMFSMQAQRGRQESFFLTQFISGVNELEPLADNCSKVYVWHTKTRPPNLLSEKPGQKSDDGIEI